MEHLHSNRWDCKEMQWVQSSQPIW